MSSLFCCQVYVQTAASNSLDISIFMFFFVLFGYNLTSSSLLGAAILLVVSLLVEPGIDLGEGQVFGPVLSLVALHSQPLYLVLAGVVISGKRFI